VSAVPIEVQDHHAVEGYAERLLLAQRMSTGRSAIATPHNIPLLPQSSDHLRGFGPRVAWRCIDGLNPRDLVATEQMRAC
jgi:hypothetical protein